MKARLKAMFWPLAKPFARAFYRYKLALLQDELHELTTASKQINLDQVEVCCDIATMRVKIQELSR